MRIETTQAPGVFSPLTEGIDFMAISEQLNFNERERNEFLLMLRNDLMNPQSQQPS
jgi:hypothetical protein